jgi:glutathione peroxidase
MKNILLFCVISIIPFLNHSAYATVTNAHDFSFISIDNKTPIHLKDYKGKVILVVNTASLCGFTKQYDALQKLYDTYGQDKLIVLAVPSNDFGQQEPEDETKIKNFCTTNFNITFPITKKYSVIGKSVHDFYQWAGKLSGFMGRPKWNFHKYLIGKNGQYIDWFSSTTEPNDKKVISAIEKALKE